MLIRHFIALLLLIVVPLILISWFATAAIRRQQQQRSDELEAIVTERLTQIDAELQAVSRQYESILTTELQKAARDVDLLREIRRRNPIVRASMLVDRDGGLVYPNRPEVDDSASVVWYSALTELARTRPVGGETESSRSKMPTNPARWQTWYQEGGLQLVFWLPRSDRTATGIVMERGRWMADLIAALPNQSEVSGRYELRDSDDRVVYRWGQSAQENAKQAAIASVRLSSPWSAWSLNYSGGDDPTGGWLGEGTAPLIASLFAIGVSLLLLGTYVLTSLRRQMNLATQRVSFASHVSHELKTPLTNIRLYTELAKRDLSQSSDAAVGEKTGRRLDIIEEECLRLSRIVSGVLAMVSRSDGGRLKTVSKSPDDVIEAVIKNFLPAFERLGIEVVMRLNAGDVIPLDEDVIDLALVNLLSNVEKYAAAGKRVEIVSSQTESRTIVDVIDHGPGIRRSAAKRIFDPFVRLNDSLDAPAGTGLGLAIARTAARRHGGDLELISTARGACFRLSFTDGDRVAKKTTDMRRTQ